MVEIRQVTPAPEDYVELCKSAGLSVPDTSVIAPGLNNSLYAACAYDGQDGPIGMARIIGDGAIFFEIVDVAVRRDRQSQGIGRHLMLNLLEWLAHNAHPTAFVTLNANAGSEGFYRSLGFESRQADEPAMFHPRWNRMETRPCPNL